MSLENFQEINIYIFFDKETTMSCRSFPIWMMAIQKRSINITPVIKNVNDYLKLKSNNLFKVARATRKSKTYDESTHIDEQKAMAEFKLESFHLRYFFFCL